ncbi:hypothetical protein THASP1DRAFT_30584 [Thamnocephalis sphaerospora]|uniref:Uncharacterized protein n=1 Tax=Thamnocephalis sphaerospora TaxID=78915 RepID=A0A4P9XNP2_9FUNG|nr:hypothetical protein THASP1DRAFT_30584 [Thamnocephalis sphaerospora]|eukprot:RKP07603.1 hypothetical protein THASP1DRAFT_30584 [Thamnocephalis sphaerospora]
MAPDEMAKAGLARLRLSKNRIMLVTRALGACSVIFPISLMLHGIFLRDICNNRTLAILGNVLCDLTASAFFCITELFLTISLCRQWRSTNAKNKHPSQNKSGSRNQESDADQSRLQNDIFFAQRLSGSAIDYKAMDDDSVDYGHALRPLSFAQPNAAPPQMLLPTRVTGGTHEPVLDADVVQADIFAVDADSRKIGRHTGSQQQNATAMTPVPILPVNPSLNDMDVLSKTDANSTGAVNGHQIDWVKPVARTRQ